jgi:hypothetical protein
MNNDKLEGKSTPLKNEGFPKLLLKPAIFVECYIPERILTGVKLNTVVKWLTLLCIRVVPGSNLSPEMSYSD